MPEPETKTDEKPPVNEEITKVLEDLRSAADKINKPEEKTVPPTVNSYADRRAALQKSLGYSDEQMAAHEEMIMRAQAPVIERTAWAEIEKRPDINTYRKEIEAELALYPQERRTPEIMTKIYNMVRGQHIDSKPQTKETPKSSGSVERSRVSGGPGYTGSEPGLSGSGSGENAPENELDEAERFVADKLSIGYKEYAASKKAGKEIRTLRVPDTRPVNSLADVELKRLTGKR